MKIAVIVGHELLNLGGSDLRNEIGDLLIFTARAKRLQNLPMIVPFLKLHLPNRRFQDDARDLRRAQVRQLSVPKFLWLFLDIFLDRKSVVQGKSVALGGVP